MATRSRTAIYMRFRESLRSHRPGPRTTTELRDFKVHKNLLAAHSDDEGSTVDARVYSVPPLWVSLVDDMNRDIARIKIKISELNTSTGKALLPGFADDDDQEEHISNTVGEVSTLFKDCERRLKELINSKDEGTDDEVSSSAVASLEHAPQPPPRACRADRRPPNASRPHVTCRCPSAAVCEEKH